MNGTDDLKKVRLEFLGFIKWFTPPSVTLIILDNLKFIDSLIEFKSTQDSDKQE